MRIVDIFLAFAQVGLSLHLGIPTLTINPQGHYGLPPIALSPVRLFVLLFRIVLVSRSLTSSSIGIVMPTEPLAIRSGQWTGTDRQDTHVASADGYPRCLRRYSTSPRKSS
jgi:hypothetical protein